MVGVVWLAHREISGPRSGGAERAAFEVSKRLVGFGHAVTILAGGSSIDGNERVIEGVRLVGYHSVVNLHSAAIRVARESNKDTVIVEDLAHVVPWATKWSGQTRGIAYFHHLHQRTLSGQVRFPAAAALALVERTYPLVYGSWPFVTESLGSVEDLVSIGIDRSQIRRIPPGVDNLVFAPGELSKKIRLIYFAGLRRYKRPDHAVRLLKLLVSRGVDAELRIVGSGPLVEPLGALARQLGVAQRVAFLGRLDLDRLVEELSHSWANVYCSVAEGWGIAAMEAAACGVPTVGYRVPGLVESVSDGASGLLVEDGSLDLLANAAERVIRSRAGWTAPCVRWAQGHSWDKVVHGWNEVLEDL